MTSVETALTLFPSYRSSFFPPNVGATQFNQTSLYGDFLSDAGTKGFALSQRFLVFIESPWLDENFAFRSSQMDRQLTLRAFSVNIPSKMFSTLERDIGGPKRTIPYTATFDDNLTIQFYCSNDMAEFGFMQKWLDGIIDPVTRYVSFYDDFAKNSKITLIFVPNSMKTIDQVVSAYQANKLRGIRYTEIYPRSMTVNSTIEWTVSGNPMFTSVSFGFREAVDITTYDQRVSDALRSLSSINAEIRGEEMMDEYYKNNPDPIADFGTLKQVQTSPIVGEAGQNARVLDHMNVPADGTPIADQGNVVNYSSAKPPFQGDGGGVGGGLGGGGVGGGGGNNFNTPQQLPGNFAA